MTGTVFGTEGGVYRVRLDSGELVEASLRGRLKQQVRLGDRIVIGDRVEIGEEPNQGATIEEVHPRDSELVRSGPGGSRPKMVAANLDRLVIVAAAARPDPRQPLLDRLLAVGEANLLLTVLVLNKMDLLPSDAVRPPFVDLYRGIGYTVVETSATTGQGVEELGQLLGTGTSALVGPSGAGKSSLLNAIDPELGLRTGELSHKVGRGRHTTVSARLIPLRSGGLVADTPGFSSVGLWGVDRRQVEKCFPEFADLKDECRFRECTHLHEPGCKVREAKDSGLIDPIRFESYRALSEETE